MIQHRLDRRLIILRGKREGAFDPEQRYFERADRTRAARQVRVYLRRMQPVTLVTPRWSQARRFLDDVSTDLLLGEPALVCRTLSLLPLEGRTPHQAWAWLVQAITEFCRLDLDGPAWQVVSRRGFRHVMRELFERAQHGERRCLMIHGAEHIHVEALRDLIQVLQEHAAERRPDPRFNMLLAGAVDADHFAFEGSRRMVLPDFSAAEAIENLVEYAGPADPALLESVVELVGGVPAMLDVLATQPKQLKQLLIDRDSVWGLLGSLAQEVRSAIDILSSDGERSERLEHLADEPRPTLPIDGGLQAAGLVRITGGQATLRAPVFGDLLLG